MTIEILVGYDGDRIDAATLPKVSEREPVRGATTMVRRHAQLLSRLRQIVGQHFNQVPYGAKR